MHVQQNSFLFVGLNKCWVKGTCCQQGLFLLFEGWSFVHYIACSCKIIPIRKSWVLTTTCNESLQKYGKQLTQLTILRVARATMWIWSPRKGQSREMSIFIDWNSSPTHIFVSFSFFFGFLCKFNILKVKSTEKSKERRKKVHWKISPIRSNISLASKEIFHCLLIQFKHFEGNSSININEKSATHLNTQSNIKSFFTKLMFDIPPMIILGLSTI